MTDELQSLAARGLSFLHFGMREGLSFLRSTRPARCFERPHLRPDVLGRGSILGSPLGVTVALQSILIISVKVSNVPTHSATEKHLF